MPRLRRGADYAGSSVGLRESPLPSRPPRWHGSPRRRASHSPSRHFAAERSRDSPDGLGTYRSPRRRKSPRPRSEHERRQHVLNIVVDRVGANLVTSVVRKYCGNEDYGCPDRFEVLEVIERVTDYFGRDGCEADPMHRALTAHKCKEVWPADEEEAREFAITMHEFVLEETLRARNEHEVRVQHVEAERWRRQHEQERQQEREQQQQQRRSSHAKDDQEQIEQADHRDQQQVGVRSRPDSTIQNEGLSSHSQRMKQPLPPRPAGMHKGKGGRPSPTPRPNQRKTELQAEPQAEPEWRSKPGTSAAQARELARLRESIQEEKRRADIAEQKEKRARAEAIENGRLLKEMQKRHEEELEAVRREKADLQQKLRGYEVMVSTATKSKLQPQPQSEPKPKPEPEPEPK